jgi:hypothetical protein
MKAVSTEQGYDYLNFYIDNILRDQWSGVDGWTREAYFVTAGNHTFRWTYAKDPVYDDNQDCCWIDNVIFPPFTTGNGITDPASTTIFNLFPNPTNGNVTLQYTVDNNSDVSIFISDAQGRVVQNVKQTTSLSAGVYNTAMNTEGLAAGVYFVNLVVNGNNQVQRLIVE